MPLYSACFRSPQSFFEITQKDRRESHLLMEVSQAVSTVNRVGDLCLPPSRAAARLVGESEVEREVLRLFEEFRDPLLRYGLSLGLAAHDAEEVVQETFLALFRHLQQGRSRENLRGWLFRVTHNLALKQCYAVK